MSAAAPVPNPPATPAEAGISREEFEELRRRLEEFQQAAERVSSSRTAEEEQRREREAREAAERVERTAERFGMTPADVGEIRGWIRAETKEAVREALDEIADVRRSDGDDPAATTTPAATLAELADDPSRPTPPADPAAPTPATPAEPEEPPAKEHWFHRPLGGNEQSADGK